MTKPYRIPVERPAYVVVIGQGITEMYLHSLRDFAPPGSKNPYRDIVTLTPNKSSATCYSTITRVKAALRSVKQTEYRLIEAYHGQRV